MNKINSHLFVLKADTAHLLMQSVRCLKIICCKSDMTLILAQLIGLRMIFEPGQLNLKAAGIILQITKREASILRLQLSGDLQSQCLLIKGDAFIQISYIDITVYNAKCHISTSVYLCIIPCSFRNEQSSAKKTML